jgi:hypothetical protein
MGKKLGGGAVKVSSLYNVVMTTLGSPIMINKKITIEYTQLGPIRHEIWYLVFQESAVAAMCFEIG